MRARQSSAAIAPGALAGNNSHEKVSRRPARTVCWFAEVMEIVMALKILASANRREV
jgi:hypothetical protein